MTSAPRTIVFATYVSPFPANSGERIRVLNLVSALRWLGYAVEAIVGNHDKADLDAHGGNGIRFRRIPFDWPRLRQSPSVYFRAHRGFVDQVRALHERSPLAAIVLDYGFMGAQIGALSEIGVPVVLGTHNVESALAAQIPRLSLAAAAALSLRQAIEFAHERWFFRRADAVLCVSEEDRKAYARFIPGERLHVVPNFVDIPDRFADTPRRNRIVMTGSFGNFQNAEGLRWFVESVWDKELQAQTALCVAGKLSDHAVREFARVPGITGLGSRDDLLSEIAQSRCAIVPLWHGGGTRLKCLEAMATRTPIVTTSKGCEGIDHGGAFRVADDAHAFKAAILELLADPAAAQDTADAARRVFDRSYSLGANAARLNQALRSAAQARNRRDPACAPAVAEPCGHE